MNIENLEITKNPQQLFDSFNNFIMSSDKRVFNKLIARTLLYDEVKDVPGDIVECGVFKGTGLYTFLKLKRLFNPNSSKKVIGFDFFNTDELISSIKSANDKETMSTLFKGRDFEHNQTFKQFLEKDILSNGFTEDDFSLIEGDITLTSKEFVDKNPGFKISLLYMDLDLEEPTYETLNNLWDNISKGGIIIFDEYAYHKWSESIGVDRFMKEKNIEIKNLNYYCPTAYIKKTTV
jgi:hypothetical protein